MVANASPTRSQLIALIAAANASKRLAIRSRASALFSVTITPHAITTSPAKTPRKNSA